MKTLRPEVQSLSYPETPPPPIRYLEGYEGSIDVVSATDGPSVDPFTKLRTRIRPPHHLNPKAPSIQDSHVEMEIIQSFSQI